MTDMLPAITDVTSATGGPMALSMRMGAGTGNIDKTANDFEAMFATQMLQPMFEGIQVDQTFGGGHGEEMMRSFMLQEYGKLIAKSGKLGIAAHVKSEMLRAQEGASGRTSTRTAATPASTPASALARNPYVTAKSNKGGVNVAVQ